MGKNYSWGQLHASSVFSALCFEFLRLCGKDSTPASCTSSPSKPFNLQNRFCSSTKAACTSLCHACSSSPYFFAVLQTRRYNSAHVSSPLATNKCVQVWLGMADGRDAFLLLVPIYLTPELLAWEDSGNERIKKKELRPCGNTVIQTGMCWYYISITW